MVPDVGTTQAGSDAGAGRTAARSGVHSESAPEPEELRVRYSTRGNRASSQSEGNSSLRCLRSVAASKEYRRPLLILGLLVSLVLLIACANVANLLTVQATARAREMALRVSIGAGRARLVQLVLVECAMLAAFASALGLVLATWSAPLVVSMLSMPEDPVRLVLETGWRELGFSFALTLVMTLLFGLPAALRASAVQPVHALKGGSDSSASGRPMKLLLSAQVTFCVTVLFVAGLFLATFHRLSTRPLGFSPESVLVIDVSAQAELPAQEWLQTAAELRGAPGVLSTGVLGWPLLSGNRWTGSVRIPGQPVEAQGPTCWTYRRITSQR